MATIKLSEWCKKTGISYITGYRWFKDGKFPAQAYQTDTGTILVEDIDEQEQIMKEENNNEAITHFLKKTVEYSNSKSSVEDFAAYILSNYKLEMQSASSEKTAQRLKNKPTPEMTSGHFQQFFPKTTKPQPKMACMDEASLEQITSGDLDPNLLEKLKMANIIEQPVNAALMSTPEVSFLSSEMQSQLVAPIVSTANYNQGIFSRADLQTNGSVVSSTLNSTQENLGFVKAASNNFVASQPAVSQADLDTWKQIFEEATEDKNFKIFVHNGVNLNHTIIKYDQAKELTDRMLKAQLLKTNDPIVVDGQVKEICKWTQEEFDYMDKIVNEILTKPVKKSRKKEVK
jgi:hypothetical protein